MRTRALWFFPAVGFLLASSPLQAVPVHQWSKGFGDAHYQVGGSVATDGSGNVIVTGRFEGTVDFGGGPLTSTGSGDMFVAKFDANGNHIWSRHFGDVAEQAGTSISTDAVGNVFVTGGIQGTVDFGGGPLTSAGDYDIVVAKFDANGNHQWSQRFGDANFQLFIFVAVDGTGNVAISGSFDGEVDFGGGPLASAGGSDIFVAKFDADGTHLWSRHSGDEHQQSGGLVSADASGSIVITGWFWGTADFGGGPLTSAGGYDIFVAKFDADGDHLWSKRFGNIAGQFGFAVASDGPGNVVVTGQFDGAVDFGGGPLTGAGFGDIFVAKLDADGNHLWSKRFGDGVAQSGRAVSADGSGDVVITGEFGGTVNFGGGPLAAAGYDIFVAKFDAGGNHLWSRRFGDFNYQGGTSVALDGSGDVTISGALEGSVDFGGGPLTTTGPGDFDIFLAKFAEPPVPVLITSFEARARGAAVEIAWDVWSDEALKSFTLYRRDDARPQAIVIAEGPFNAMTRSHFDSDVEPGKTYHYELLIRTQDGEGIHSPIASATVPRFESTLAQNFPNPFTPSTTIEYTLGERSSAVLGIYDAAGRLVVRLDEGVHDAGTYRAEWNGRDVDGRLVGSGVYFCRLEDAPWTAARKMVLVR
jgi:FlgD Ig-like domain